LLVNVGIFADGNLPDPSKPLTGPPPVFAALVDTGASCTCVSKKVIDECKLVVHSKKTMMSASGTVEANAFMFYVGLPVAILLPGQTIGPSGLVNAVMHTFGNPVQGLELLRSHWSFRCIARHGYLVAVQFEDGV
jgi:hypothetical protein